MKSLSNNKDNSGISSYFSVNAIQKVANIPAKMYTNSNNNILKNNI